MSTRSDEFYRKLVASNKLIGLLQGKIDRRKPVRNGDPGDPDYIYVPGFIDPDETEDSLKAQLKSARESRRNFFSQAEDDAFVNSGNASQSVIGSKMISAKGGRRTRRYKRGGNKKRSGHKRLHKKRTTRRR
jgi:hypothetical protein